jgi:hydrogenase expression/formation protein HypC
MCTGIPGKIVEIIDPIHRIAKVEVSGQPRKVNLALLAPEEGKIGEWVLVHAGLAMQRLEETEAREVLDFLAELDNLFEEEVE